MTDLVAAFLDTYCDLVQTNCRIGWWDHQRHQEAAKDIADVDVTWLVKTERQGRANVEERSRLKSRIDELFAELTRCRQN